VQRKSLWRFFVLKRNSAVRCSQIETKLSYLAIGKAQLNACAFSDGVEKQKCCLGPGDIKTVITFLLYNFLFQNLAGCFATAIATVSVSFTFFPIVGIGAINFQSKKTGNPPLFSGVFSLQKKRKKFFISIFINCTIWLTFLWRICVSIVKGFPSRAFLKQRLAHSSASAKTIPAFWHQTAATNIPWTGEFIDLSWPHRTSANIINTCFWLLETCTKCSYFIEENIRPGAQRLAFEVMYEYIVRQPRIYRGLAFCAWASFQTSGDWSVTFPT